MQAPTADIKIRHSVRYDCGDNRNSAGDPLAIAVSRVDTVSRITIRRYYYGRKLQPVHCRQETARSGVYRLDRDFNQVIIV